MFYFIVAVICTSTFIPPLLVHLGTTFYKRYYSENRALLHISLVIFLIGFTSSRTFYHQLFTCNSEAIYFWDIATMLMIVAFVAFAPRFLNIYFVLKGRVKKINDILSLLGFIFFTALLTLSIFSPAAILQEPSPSAVYPCLMMTRNYYTPVSFSIITFIFLYAIYIFFINTVYVIKNTLFYKKILSLGILLGSILFFDEIIYLIFGFYIDPFDENAFPRFLVGLSFCATGALLSIIHKMSSSFKIIESEKQAIVQKQEELTVIAYTDKTTESGNKQALLRDLFPIPENAALLFVDIDNFKFINKYYNFETGDILLRRMAELCKSAICHETGKVYRYNADIFAILLSGNSGSKAEKIAAQIVLQTRSLILYETEDAHFTVSIGIAETAPGDTSSRLINRSESALGIAKKDRDRFAAFNPGIHKDEKRRHDIVSGLHRSLDESGFTLMYQPIISSSQKVMGAEALLRWSHPEMGTVSPGEFIPIAEDTGMISRITQFAIKTAVENISGIASLFCGQVHINLSAQDITNHNLIDYLDEVIEDYSSVNKILGFEITETAIISDLSVSIKNLNILRERGFSIALDDFGTGYSSLSYLHMFPMDKMKIDRTFITNINDNPKNAILLDTMIRLAADLNLEVIMEGIEERDQFDYLLEKNCRLFQGFYFARPLPLDDFKNFLVNTP